MRYMWSAFLAAVLAGCGVEVLTTTAIQGELQAQQLQAMRGQIGNASDSAAKASLRKAIDTYYAEKGTYPLTLSSLAPDYLPSVPTKADGSPFDYDPNTGRLLDAPAISGAWAAQGPSDEQKLAEIRAAIDRYGQATGFYPASLQALVPQYLATVPKSASGQSFAYNPQDGALSIPGRGSAQTAAPARGMGGAGAGPMGEVMTGMAVQQQLNSMGSSGASAVSGYGREKLGDVTSQHNQQQEQALNELGQ